MKPGILRSPDVEEFDIPAAYGKNVPASSRYTSSSEALGRAPGLGERFEAYQTGSNPAPSL